GCAGRLLSGRWSNPSVRLAPFYGSPAHGSLPSITIGAAFARSEDVAMKISVMIANSYIDRAAVQGRYPIPGARYDKDVGAKSLEAALGNARLADELGFDWISVSEHHFGPGIMTPNPHVFAGALTQVVKRATIALLGPIVSINNPVRLAVEIALLDQISGGPIVPVLLRGTPNELNTYHAL